MAPRVSVAIATRNGVRFVGDQLASIAAQSRAPEEIVICDDCSTDGTLGVLEAFRRSCSIPVRIEVNESPLGVSRNFERALSLCTGDVLFLCDQDDVWFPEKISVVLAKLASDQALMVVTNDQIIGDESLTQLGPTKTANMLRLGLEPGLMCTGCCTAIRREFLEFVEPFCTEWAHDNWIGTLGSLLEVKGFINRPLQLYRRHGSNVSHWVASSLRPIGMRERFPRKSSSAMIAAWKRRLRINQWMTSRLMERDAWLECHGLRAKASRALESLLLERRDFERRLEIANSGFPRRLRLALRCLLDGGYARFGGFRSMLADLTRPT